MSWRREKGAGPIFLNLIHDVDLLRYLCGDVVAVQAAQSNRVRGNGVEEIAVVILHLASGALGTVNVSDTIQSPWSWEFSAGENPAYSHVLERCYRIGGTRASLAISQLDLWQHPSQASWWAPIERERLRLEKEDPLGLQEEISQICVVWGKGGSGWRPHKYAESINPSVSGANGGFGVEAEITQGLRAMGAQNGPDRLATPPLPLGHAVTADLRSASLAICGRAGRLPLAGNYMPQSLHFTIETDRRSQRLCRFRKTTI